MAKEPGRDKPIEELRDEIARSRERVARNLSGLRDELDFSRKIRRSFRRRPVLWIAAATALGLFFTVVPVRKKKVYVSAKSGGKSKLLEAGFLLGALKIVASVFKPVIVSFLRKKVADYAGGSGSRRNWRA